MARKTEVKQQLFLFYMQYDHRHDGTQEWEEMIVRARTTENALKISSLDIYDRDRIYIEPIGTAISEEEAIVCYGFHDHETSWGFLKEGIKYVKPTRSDDMDTDEGLPSP